MMKGRLRSKFRPIFLQSPDWLSPGWLMPVTQPPSFSCKALSSWPSPHSLCLSSCCVLDEQCPLELWNIEPQLGFIPRAEASHLWGPAGDSSLPALVAWQPPHPTPFLPSQPVSPYPSSASMSHRAVTVGRHSVSPVRPSPGNPTLPQVWFPLCLSLLTPACLPEDSSTGKWETEEGSLLQEGWESRPRGILGSTLLSHPPPGKPEMLRGGAKR
jgi:hypothetical protein